MKTKSVNYPKSRFSWDDIERIKKNYGVDSVWMCRENGSDALAVEKGGDMTICKGSIVSFFDGVTASKFLLHRRDCEKSKRISKCICHRDVPTNSFEWAAVVATATKGMKADCWFAATPESIAGHGVVEVAEDALDNPYVDYALVNNRGPFD